MIVDRQKSKIVVMERKGGITTIGGVKRINKAELMNQLTMRRMFNKKRCAEFYGVGIVPELIQTISVSERNRHSRAIMYGGMRRWSFAEFTLPWCIGFWQWKREDVRRDYHGILIGQWMAEEAVQSMIGNMTGESYVNVG